MEPIIEFEKFTFKYRSQVNPTLFGHRSKDLSRGKGADRRAVRLREINTCGLHQRADARSLIRAKVQVR